MAFIKLFSYHYARHKRHVHLTVAGIILIAGITGAMSLLRIKEPAIAQANQPPHKPSSFKIGSYSLSTSADPNDAPIVESINDIIGATLFWQGGDPDGDPVSYQINLKRYLSETDTNPYLDFNAFVTPLANDGTNPSRLLSFLKDNVTLVTFETLISGGFGSISGNNKGSYFALRISGVDTTGTNTATFSDWAYLKVADHCNLKPVTSPIFAGQPASLTLNYVLNSTTNLVDMWQGDVIVTPLNGGGSSGTWAVVPSVSNLVGPAVQYGYAIKKGTMYICKTTLVIDAQTGIAPVVTINNPLGSTSGNSPFAVNFSGNIDDFGGNRGVTDWKIDFGDSTNTGWLTAGNVLQYSFSNTHTYTGQGGAYTPIIYGKDKDGSIANAVTSSIFLVTTPSAPKFMPSCQDATSLCFYIFGVDDNNSEQLEHALFNVTLGKYQTPGSSQLFDTPQWSKSYAGNNINGLSKAYPYSFKLKARSPVNALVESVFGPETKVATWPELPGTPTVFNNATGQTIVIDPKQNSNFAEYRIEVLSSAYANTGAACGSAGKCVPPSGGAVVSCVASERWGAYSGFGSASGVGATGLTDGQIYGYRVMARSVNGDGTYNTLSTCSSKVDLQYSPGGPPPPGPPPSGGGALPVRLSVIKEVVSPADGVVTTPGATVSYKITVTNWGTDDAAQNYKITDILPPGFTNPRNFAGANPVAPAISGRKLIWDLNSALNPLLKDGGQLVITYDATAP